MKNYFRRSFYTSVPIWKRTGKDITEKCLMNTAILITLAAFLFMVTSCSYYRATTKVSDGSVNLLTATINKFYPEYDYPRAQYPISNLQKMFFMEYNVYAVDSAGRWQLTDAEIINDRIYAMATSSPAPPDSVTDIPEDGVSVRYHPKEESDLLKRIFIYTGKVEFNQGGKAYFPMKEITQIITFKDHPAAKVGFTFLIIGGIITLTLIIAIAMSEPFSYD